MSNIKNYDAVYNKKAVSKVCACEILAVKSNRQAIENIAVFSEKTNNGDLSADFAVAKEVLEQEKKHMKFFFYQKMKVIQKIVTTGDCKTVFKQLQVQNTDLKMYELLDADAISKFNNLN
jgi:hypothetical protein